MFGTSGPTLHSQTLQLTPSDDSLAIQLSDTHQCITSFTAWMETCNIFTAITVVNKTSKAVESIVYLSISQNAI